jgi:hypothetical protein
MTPSRSVQTRANRALKVLPVALARAEYVPMAMTQSPVSKNSDGSVCQSSKSENRCVKKSVTPESPT